MKPIKICLVFTVVIITAMFSASAQPNQEPSPKLKVFQQSNDGKRTENAIRVMFYNTENLFDPADDTTKSDEEYQPTGMRSWTFNRMKTKLQNISKVVLSVGGWEPPEIIGLCEIENRAILYRLTNETSLKYFNYRIIHFESPDPRGIDVAMLYRPEKVKVIHTEAIPVLFLFDTVSRTRDILYVKITVNKRDTINIFVNHWPSKFGGATSTIPKRNHVANLVRFKVDSILAANPLSNILIMGDLNDSPFEESVSKILGAKMDSVNIASNELYNMVAGAGISWKKGTIKFREQWETIDHMIISKPLLTYTTPHSMKIFDAPFLLQDDEAWFGKKPFRTYHGATYTGGFSDHLPVYMDITFNH